VDASHPRAGNGESPAELARAQQAAFDRFRRIWRAGRGRIGQALAREPVGLEESAMDAGACFGPVAPGYLDDRRPGRLHRQAVNPI
jgi:hypothetical protein